MIRPTQRSALLLLLASVPFGGWGGNQGTAPQSGPQSSRPKAGPATSLAWSVIEMSPRETAVLIQLHERLDTVGTAPTPTVIRHDPDRLRYSFLFAAKQLDPKPTNLGFSLMDIGFESGGGQYKLDMMWRAKKGAREEDYHAVLGREEDDARVVVYVTGPDKETRTKVIAMAEAHYAERPRQLNCIFTASDPQGSPSIRWRMCYPQSDADFMLTAKDLQKQARPTTPATATPKAGSTLGGRVKTGQLWTSENRPPRA